MKRFLLCVSFLALFVISAEAATFKALLVSIEKYELAPLDFAENDVGKLATVLMSRYDCQAQACIDTATSGDDSAKDSIMKRIREWCDLLHDDDTAILYLAGHGVKDEQGKLYLAMTDFSRDNFDTAAIPLEWIRRQFEGCDGKNKLLLIDTCFAGTGKSIDFGQATIEEVSASFSGMKNVVSIASCHGDEKSWLWGETKHSLFTYWLIEGLKGHADRNGDQHITVDELFEYLNENVSWAARKSLDKEQHPTPMNIEAGKDFRLALRAISFQSLIDDVAEQIDLQLRLEKFATIGVPEFTTGHADTFEPEYGSLPRWGAEALRRALLRKSRNNRSGYEVLAETALQEMLREKGITPNDIGTEKTKELTVDGVKIPLLIRGRFSFFSSIGLSFQAELLDTKGKIEVAQVGGSALLNCKEMALCGLSGKFFIAGSSSTGATNSSDVSSGETTVTAESGNEEGKLQTGASSDTYTSDAVYGLVTQEQKEEEAQVIREKERPHPMADPSCPFKVAFETRLRGSMTPYSFRQCSFDGNRCFLPVNRGEEYQICLRNESSEPVFARVLVDGLNTLSQPLSVIAKGAFVEEAPTSGGGAGGNTSTPTGNTGGATGYVDGATGNPGGATGNSGGATGSPGGATATSGAVQTNYQFAPRVDLEGARPWILRPRVDYQIPGFVDANHQEATLQRFYIVDADESVAARNNYTEQIGTITVAIFRMVPPARSVGTAAGEVEPVYVEYYEGPMVPGEMLVAMNIRYLSAETFKGLTPRNPAETMNPRTIKPQPARPGFRSRR